MSSNTTSHYHLFSLIVPYITSRIFYCFSVSILTMYVLECVIVWGVSLSGSSGDEPTAGFSLWTSLSILGWKTTIRSEVAPHACCALIASELSVPTESRRTETQTHAALGCVMSDEARWASKTAAAVLRLCLRAPNEDRFAGLHCSINRDYNARGSGHSRRQVVSGDRVSAMLSVNPYFPDASAPLCAQLCHLMTKKSSSEEMPSQIAAARFSDSDSDQSVIFCILGLAIKKILF